jgi:PhnB protein
MVKLFWEKKMSERPTRYRNAVVPHLYVEAASRGIAFYERAFGGVELFRVTRPAGKIVHAEVSIGDSVFMVGDPDDKLYAEPKALGRCTAGLHIFTDDNAGLLQRAVAAGAEEMQPPTDLFKGRINSACSARRPACRRWSVWRWNAVFATRWSAANCSCSTKPNKT